MSQDSNGKVNEEMPKTEVVAKPKRRRFTAAEKQRLLREVDACQGSGEIGALLRREGLYASYLTTWRRQREQGELDGLSPQKRGPKPDPQAIELARLRRENERLQERLRQAELIIDVHTCPGGRCQGKKVAQMLGLAVEENNPDGRR
jgi:transposase-like protein